MKTMKKMLALLLALAMAFSLCGCAESLQQIEIPPFPEVTPTPAPVIVSTETPSPTAQATTEPGGSEILIPATAAPTPDQEGSSTILVNIGRFSRIDYDPAEGTELILDFSYAMPRVVMEENPAAAEKINELLATIEETFYTGNSYGLDLSFLGYNTMLESAEDNYTYVKEYQVEGMSLEFSDNLSAKVTRLDDGALSLLYADASYTGGAHGSYWEFAYTFDPLTGEILKLDRLSSDYDALADFLVQTMLDLAEQDEDNYYSDRIVDEFLPEGGREEAFRNLLREGSWYFDREGLVFFSTLYELGPYAAGITEFHIPYSQLEGKIDPRYLFPADRGGKGRMIVKELAEMDGGDLEIVDKLSVTEGGQQLCLVAEGRVYDVRVSTVYYVDRFYENTQLWSASTLQNCVLQLEAVVPEGLPDLLITYYTADGERHGKLLSQSAADGSYMLVDDNIEAVG